MIALLAETPALPLHTAGKYVAAAYVVLFVLVLIYVAIMALRLSRIERQLGELLELTERPPAAKGPPSAGAGELEPETLDPVHAESTPA
jgi:CcmD family protein